MGYFSLAALDNTLVEKLRLERFLRDARVYASLRDLNVIYNGENTLRYLDALNENHIPYTFNSFSETRIKEYYELFSWETGEFDLQKAAERPIYPITVDKAMKEIKEQRGERVVRVIPSEQTDMLTEALNQQSIDFVVDTEFFRKPMSYQKEYSFDLRFYYFIDGSQT